MELLPDLAMLQVFSFVNVEERFGTLRLVCRRWKEVVDFQIKRDLVVYGNVHPFKDRWPSDDRQIDLLDIMSQPCFNFCLANGHCKAIRRLFLCQIDLRDFEHKKLMAKLLNCVCQLEELSMDQTRLARDLCLYNSLGLNLNDLILPNLKVLSVKQFFMEKLSITASKLEKLVIWDCSFLSNREKGLMINVSHPERLRSLQCQLIDKETAVFPKLLHLSARHAMLDFKLSEHRKLKRLDLCLASCFCSAFDFSNYLSNFYVTAEQLIEQKRELKLNHLEITNFGIRDELTTSWLDINNEHPTFLGLYGGDLNRLARQLTIDYLPWRLCVNTSDLNKHFGQLAHTRLNIEWVGVGHPNGQLDPDLLIKFLVQIGGVKFLCFGTCPLPQEFFDQLSRVPYIGMLSMFNGELPKDFEFINNIRFLNQIEIWAEKFAFDSFFGSFKRSKIKNLLIRIVCVGPCLILKNNRIRINKRGREREFDNLNAALTDFKSKCNPALLM